MFIPTYCQFGSEDKKYFVEDYKYNKKFEDVYKKIASASAANNQKQKEHLLKHSASEDYALLKLSTPVIK